VTVGGKRRREIVEALRIDAGATGSVSALLLRPPGAWVVYVLAHGAGAGMTHPFMTAIAEALAARRVATLRYQFPYVEAGRRRPDQPGVAQATVRAAVRTAAEAIPDMPLIAGGKSFGGRMTSLAAATGPLPDVRGLVFLGFPLHRPGAPGVERAGHLADVRLPMLFLQGTRDALAERSAITSVCRRLGPLATMHLVDGGDHSFGVPKRSGRDAASVMGELADTIRDWARNL
jgi:predicted alpha/beta-hydrolase family hydrolase